MRVTSHPFSSFIQFDPLPTYTWSSTPVVAAQGWQCPVCKTVYAPVVSACYCSRLAQTSTSTSTTSTGGAAT